MWILPLVGYVGAATGFAFLTLAIASGLYYLSELVEEHTVFAKRFLTRLIYTIIGVQIVLCLFDGFPAWPTLLGVAAHAVYLANMRRFPYVQLSDPLFVMSVVLVLADHYAWFRYFSGTQVRAYKNMSSYYDAPRDVPTFSQIASYFGLCVWLVPFALFVSLSASDNVLPSISPTSSARSSGDGFAVTGIALPGASAASGSRSSTRRAGGGGMAKALVDNVLTVFGAKRDD